MERIIVFASIILLITPACTRTTIIAEVDGAKITAADLAAQMRTEKEKYDSTLLKTPENVRAFKKTGLNQLIQEAILLNEAKSKGLRVSDDELKTAIEKNGISSDLWKEKQRRRLLISKLVRQEVTDKIPVSPEETHQYYKTHIKDFFKPQQYHALQIVVDNKELANQIASKIASGGDFAALAQEYSLSPDRKRGGDLGFFDASSFPPIFSEICGKLAPGQASEVVATDYGYQIFKLIEKKPSHQLTEKEVKSEIEYMMREKRMEKAFDEWFTELSKKADIKIFEKALEEINV